MLAELGLTPTEAKIYLAGLSSDSMTIKEIGFKTKVKRPTIYHSLGTLQEKGLVFEKKDGSKSRFAMSSPEQVRTLIERKRELVERQASSLDGLIALLKAEQKAKGSEGVEVVQYTGTEGMKMVLDVAFYCKSKKWDIIAPIQNFLREYDKEYAERYKNARKYHDITARTLWEFTSGTRELSPDEIEARNPRYMPAVMQGRFKSMMILFDNKVAIFSSYENLSAVLITSKDVHSLFQAMFDGLWEVSEGY